MTPLSDATLGHLRQMMDWPDLGPRYAVTGRLAEGGMSVVYAARDTVLDREVAVKVLDRHDLSSGDRDRLAQEARILAHLEHPGIVPVHDAGSLPDGRPFYVMKRVRGARLGEAASTASLDERLRMFERVLEAVAFAHAHGIVHRDLKPENVMVGEFGEVLVLDWGVAKMLREAGGGTSASSDTRPADGTWRGTVLGTPGFMAPEQAAGEPVDHRADIHALGVVLDVLLPGLAPRPLAAIAARARAASADGRYATVADLQADLGRYREGNPVSAYRESWIERGLRVAHRYRVPLGLVLAYLMMRLALLGWMR